jgi:hypothetical protein
MGGVAAVTGADLIEDLGAGWAEAGAEWPKTKTEQASNARGSEAEMRMSETFLDEDFKREFWRQRLFLKTISAGILSVLPAGRQRPLCKLKRAPQEHRRELQRGSG